jgi:hypothetical protein
LAFRSGFAEFVSGALVSVAGADVVVSTVVVSGAGVVSGTDVVVCVVVVSGTGVVSVCVVVASEDSSDSDELSGREDSGTSDSVLLAGVVASEELSETETDDELSVEDVSDVPAQPEISTEIMIAVAVKIDIFFIVVYPF